MSTKQRIIETAKTLFNEEGTKNVTTNHVAKALNISPGNLYYHYKNKEEIIRSVYQNMLDVLADVWKDFETERLSLKSFKTVVAIYNVLYDYRFFQYEIISLLENDEMLKKMYNDNRKIRYRNFEGVINKMIEEKILIPKGCDSCYSLLIDQLWFTGDFWMTYAKSINNQFDDKELQKLLLTQMSLFYRYSTEKGKRLICRLENLIRREK
ncbi:MAG TPA: TetR/AcrR family transcriptional regulator [Candidatus Cloacimonadota bacterium]|nr:TetR/AcrR family transcriptional regulator [Candidatus Cloacimonadota bacterium]